MFLLSWLSQKLFPTEETSHQIEDSFPSAEALVVQSIPPGGKGKIRLHGVYWNAKSSILSQFPIPVDTLVSVKARVDLTLWVEPLPLVALPATTQQITQAQTPYNKVTTVDLSDKHIAA